jgi:putative addiction module killer protein
MSRLKTGSWRAWPGSDWAIFGDAKAVGDGVRELRIDAGPGYRVYFVRREAAVYVLLTGGDKGSQKRDIEAAKAMARELKEEDR